VIWWFILYWPIMGALIFIANRVAKQYPLESVARRRADIALGCGIIGLPSFPLIVFAMYWASRGLEVIFAD
jgi:hypothetical protein